MDSLHVRGETVLIDVVRRSTCEDESTTTLTEETTHGRRIGGWGRTTEWVVVGLGVAAMGTGIALNLTEPPSHSKDCCDWGRGTILAIVGSLAAGYAGAFLGVDHTLTYESKSRAVVGVTRKRRQSPCGEGPAAGVEVALQLPSGPVRATTDA